MAVTNLYKNTGTYAEELAPRLRGEGVIEDSDELAIDVKNFPIGTQYLNISNSELNVRTAENGVAADFLSTTLT